MPSQTPTPAEPAPTQIIRSSASVSTERLRDLIEARIPAKVIAEVDWISSLKQVALS